jgi:hypothetical protein
MPKLLEQMRHQIRLNHYSLRTETAYLRGVRDCILWQWKSVP